MTKKLKEGSAGLLVTCQDRDGSVSRARVKIQKLTGGRKPFIAYEILKSNYFARKGKLGFNQDIPMLKKGAFLVQRLCISDERDIAGGIALVKSLMEKCGLKVLEMTTV